MKTTLNSLTLIGLGTLILSSTPTALASHKYKHCGPQCQNYCVPQSHYVPTTCAPTYNTGCANPCNTYPGYQSWNGYGSTNPGYYGDYYDNLDIGQMPVGNGGCPPGYSGSGYGPSYQPPSSVLRLSCVPGQCNPPKG